MPKSLDELTKVLQDTVYVGIGLGVIAFQKAQVQRQALAKNLEGAVDQARTAVEDNLKLVEERLRSIR
jgi:hypothetical protein